ncbi:MAG: hypothetical protein ACLGH8_01320 [Bacteroidia bacterium]
MPENIDYIETLIQNLEIKAAGKSFIDQDLLEILILKKEIIEQLPNIKQAATIPTRGSYPQGFIIINTNPTTNNIFCWVCTQTGNNSSWKPLRLLELGFSAGNALEGSQYGDIDIIEIPQTSTSYKILRTSKKPCLYTYNGSVNLQISINYETIENYGVKQIKVLRKNTANGTLTFVSSNETTPRCVILLTDGESGSLKKGAVADLYMTGTSIQSDTNYYTWNADGKFS